MIEKASRELATMRKWSSHAINPMVMVRGFHNETTFDYVYFIFYLPLFVVVHFGLHSHNISLKTTRMLLVLGREWEYGTML